MKVKIHPGSIKETVIHIPPSKSLAHRNIICAALSDGISIIDNIAYSKDILATINALKCLNIQFEQKESSLVVYGNSKFEYTNGVVDCNESGSTLRFLIPIFSLCNSNVKFTGKGRLMERPQTIYEKIFNERNLHFEMKENILEIEGALKGGEYVLDGNVSSQFISGLLFTLPLCENESMIHINPPFESASYVYLTIDCLKKFGIHVEFKDKYTIIIPGNQKYKACNTSVEADYSQLVFFEALGFINNKIECTSFNKASLQGDKACVSIGKNMSGCVEETQNGYIFSPSQLNGTVIDLEDCPDLGPMLFALATQANGPTTFNHIRRLRIKESDRVEAMIEELSKLGCKLESTEDTLTVYGPSVINGNAELNGHNDHRIVMALSVLSTIAKNPCVINDAQAISKSYPTFFEDLESCGIEVETYE